MYSALPLYPVSKSQGEMCKTILQKQKATIHSKALGLPKDSTSIQLGVFDLDWRNPLSVTKTFAKTAYII